MGVWFNGRLRGWKMRLFGVMAGLAGATMVAGALLSAAPALAQSAPRATPLTAAEAQRAQQHERNRPGLEWNRNRWGLNLDLDQSADRETDWGGVEAGAYYRINPRLSVGATAGLAATPADPIRPRDEDRRNQPRVRLETIFRF